jgi:hypothetical protein
MILKLLGHNDQPIEGDWATIYAVPRYVRQRFINDGPDEVISGVRQIEDDVITNFMGEKYIGAGYRPIREGRSFSWIPR